MKSIFDIFSKTVTTKVKLNAPYGIHLRPCAKIASIAKSYDGKVFIISDKNKVDAKDMNKILALGLKDGDEILLSASGKNANLIIDKIATFLLTLTNEKDNNVKIETTKSFDFEGKATKGTTISSGIAIGIPYLWQNNFECKIVDNQTFDNAYRQTLDDLNLMSDNDIFMAQKALLETLPSNSFEEFKSAIKAVITSLRGSEHEAKIADYKDLLNSIKTNMSDTKNVEFPKNDFIVIADELLPSDILKLADSSAKGVVVKNLSPRSHAALLLRSHKIPAISIDKNIENINDTVILDATNGLLVIEPSEDDLVKAKKEIEKNSSSELLDFKARFEGAITKDGKKIKVQANIADVQSAKEALMSGCDGIGLLRSEFLFQKEKPSVDEQCRAYGEIFELFDEVTVRTLDIGGDKSLPYIKLNDEQNPFLGIRGVRLLKTHKDIISEQLLAILKASRKKDLKVMFPMVATVDEFVEAKELALTIAKENKLNLDNVSFGIMIEVPSVLFLLEEFNKVVDFYSIGTNDLSQYLFAIDRTHNLLSIDSHSSVLYDALKLIADKALRPVSICGELASDEEAVSRLISIGIDTLSVPSKIVPTIKSRIRDI
ncbi:MAG: HPr family phosphocarrier protein [Sulfurovaceae bacterium]|nr:HPr family phosphocarrier protein [Sulfurovaceae bacterium]MDD5548398.1 HPr family phosphocarrier protein [Sulfurovaceae bacterium]